MDKTPIEIKLMNDLKFIINLHEEKSKLLYNSKKIVKNQEKLINEYINEIKKKDNINIELNNKINELSNKFENKDIYRLHII